MNSRAFQEIMGQAIVELRQALAEDPQEAGGEGWDPDAFEQVVRQFTQELGQQMLQVWAEVRTEQAQAQGPFVLTAEQDASCTDGNPSGG